MNRPIKLRAWDKERKSWIHPEEFKINGLGKPVWTLLGNDEVELMQFTNLLDRHGKEIYEGDIVRECTGAIYIQGLCGVSKILQEGATTKSSWLPENWWIEVIGNIYENPELLDESPKPTASQMNERLEKLIQEGDWKRQQDAEGN